jgi:mRNA-degrading endonuclease YafQ of YafQ-DinJ toxin-antitoxin module
MKILILPKFARQFKKLPETVKKSAREREKIFRQDPFDPRLKTHKLHGVLAGFYAFSISYSYRIIFDFADPDTVRFYMVGDHDIYEIC